jgi:hypothetical protein
MWRQVEVQSHVAIITLAFRKLARLGGPAFGRPSPPAEGFSLRGRAAIMAGAVSARHVGSGSMRKTCPLSVVLFAVFSGLACSFLGAPAPVEPTPVSATIAVEPAPTATPLATPTRVLPPTSEARPSAGEGISSIVAVDSVRWYTLPFGSLFFIGLATNTGSQELKSVEVVLILEDESGRAVAAEFGNLERDLIPSGEVSPFELVFLELPPAWQDYQILLQGGKAEYVERCHEFEVVSQDLERLGSGTSEIKGEIKNTGTQTCEYIHISAAFYDAGGNLVGVGSSYARRDQVEPGETSRFELLHYDSGLGKIDHFELWVEGTPER